MPQIVNNGSKLIRINTAKNTLESSQNGGITWVTLNNNANSFNCGTFIDLIYSGRDLLACTSKGLYVSKNDGLTFILKCANSLSHGDFQAININGQELLATTSKGLYYSRNGGISWIKR